MLNLTITDDARAKLHEYAAGDARYLKLAVKPGGCSGMTYSATLEAAPGPGDAVVYEEGDLRIVADPRSALFLDGLQIDYSSDLIQAGFRFANRHAKASCGCGASFSV